MMARLALIKMESSNPTANTMSMPIDPPHKQPIASPIALAAAVADET